MSRHKNHGELVSIVDDNDGDNNVDAGDAMGNDGDGGGEEEGWDGLPRHLTTDCLTELGWRSSVAVRLKPDLSQQPTRSRKSVLLSFLGRRLARGVSQAAQSIALSSDHNVVASQPSLAMSILCLPTELLQSIAVHIPSSLSFSPLIADTPKAPWGPLVELEPTLRSLCATNRGLRAIFLPYLYDTIGINLCHPDMNTKCARVEAFFLHTHTDILRLIRLVVQRSWGIPVSLAE